KFDAKIVGAFFALLRRSFAGLVACEPRHVTWFTDAADTLLDRFQVARVAADPALSPRAAAPGGWDDFAYWRLHGSPDMYYSNYTPDYRAALAAKLKRDKRPVWCIFDNTARGAATHNAMALQRLIE